MTHEYRKEYIINEYIGRVVLILSGAERGTGSVLKLPSLTFFAENPTFFAIYYNAYPKFPLYLYKIKTKNFSFSIICSLVRKPFFTIQHIFAFFSLHIFENSKQFTFLSRYLQ